MRMQGQLCELRALDDKHADEFADFLNLGINFEHTFTGSIPMRPIDVAAEWEMERERRSVQWGIHTTYRDLGFIGTTGLYSHRDIYRSWEFRILIGHPEALGQGIGSEVTRMVTDWGFSKLNAHRVWLGVSSENARAIKCYLGVGFKEEGRLRDEIWSGGHYVDAIRMSILEIEWKSIGLSS